MKHALSAVLLMLVATGAFASGDEAEWSTPVNGLRARLVILPPAQTNTPFCRVLLEMQNVGDVAGQKEIRFSPARLDLRIADSDGRELPVSNDPYDGMSPLWEPTLLPYAGSIRFQISFPGLGYRPTKDMRIVDVGAGKAWVVPQDGSEYWLSGKLSILKEPGDHPHKVWSGTLELPKVKIPEAE